MKTYTLFLAVLITVANYLSAAPPATSPFIRVDQFGYFPTSNKVAVISNPQQGFDANQSFSPGQQYQVRRWDDHEVVFAGAPEAWNGGKTHAQSGDQGWWFDFSAVTAPGTYYVYDTQNQVGSSRFDIGKNVYDKVLEQAIRMFYYQRVNYAKQAPYAGKWTDGASFEGPNQDRAAHSVNDRDNPQSARDLHGGWYDAGDLNKYTTFTFEPLTQMLEAYRMNPKVFKDNYNIPESGNGVADLLDEIKYELDWLTRMQDATSTDGLLLKVGTVGFGGGFPPSQNNEPRYYVGECTSATITGAAVFAISGLVYQSLPSSVLQAYGQDLIARAERAWVRARATTQNYTVFETDCDVVGVNGLPIVRAGDADDNEQKQKDKLVTAAAYLYEATGRAEYRTYVETRYSQATGFRVNSPNLSWPYATSNAFAMLRYTILPNVSSDVAQTITNRKAKSEPEHSLEDYRAEKDLYRAHMEDRAYHWGSNQIRANSGNVLMDFHTFGINDSDKAQYREAAEQYVHWLHGVNPLGLVMLSNMYDYGAERSANEMAHAWFADGTKYDNAQTSELGPAPGYVTGGPNKENYPLNQVNPPRPPFGQPQQKSYRDWNTDEEESYAITEPGIYYQGSYVALLSRLISIGRGSPPPTAPPVASGPRYVYRDALAKGWQNWSWSAEVGLTQSAVVQEGINAMKVSFQKAEGAAGVSLRSEEAISTETYGAIRMALHGGNGADQELLMYVQTEDEAGGSQTKALTARAGAWQQVTVPLSELGNPPVIKRITLQNNAARTDTPFYIDNLRLVTGEETARTATAQQQIRVYPNELGEHDALQLRWDQPVTTAQRVEVVDLQGRVVYQMMHQGNQLQISRDRFPRSGIYVIRMRSPHDTKPLTTLRVMVR